MVDMTNPKMVEHRFKNVEKAISELNKRTKAADKAVLESESRIKALEVD